jgi:hypothetical protein
MAKKLTQSDVAEWILDILVNEIGLKPGDPIPDQKLKERYRARNGDSADIGVGLEYGAAQEWVTYDRGTDTWHLTEFGHERA